MLTDSIDVAEKLTHEELELPEVEAQADDPMVSDKPENQVLDNSTETQEDFEADASDDLGEGQIGGDDTEIDDTDQSDQ